MARDYSGMLKAELSAELAERGIEITEGSGKEGRVLIADILKALREDDAAKVAGASFEGVGEEREVSVEAVEGEPEVSAATEEKPPGGKMPEVGEIVYYRDKFSAGYTQARISFVHDARTVNLAVFRNSGVATDHKAGVTYGNDPGCWRREVS